MRGINNHGNICVCPECLGETDMDYVKLKDDRFKANVQLLELLRSLVYTYPDLRFSQIMANFDFVIQNSSLRVFETGSWVDEYHTEPMVLLERVKLAIDKVNSNQG